MIKILMATGAVLVASAALAFAADLSATANPEPTFEEPPPIPVFTWTGVYIGVQSGYQFGHDHAVLATPAGSLAYGTNPRGTIGGGHLGFNYMAPEAFGTHGAVLGIEADIAGANVYRDAGFGPLGSSGTNTNLEGSIRGRLGVSISRVMFYATGGAAFADFETRYNATPLFGAGSVGTRHRSRVGYTVGGGVEYAFMNNFSVRGEYRYSDYGTFVDTSGVAGATVSHRETDSRLQAGFDYKFDSILPAASAGTKY